MLQQNAENMAIETKMDISVWERFSDSVGAFSEGVVGFLGRMFGSSNECFVRGLGYITSRDPEISHTVTPGSLLARVNALEEAMHAKTEAELKGMTAHFRERLAQGETLEDLLPEAFAACREAGRRTKNMRHFDVQILGGIVLHRGNIAEMVTGEGKTLVATLPAYLNAPARQGRSRHHRQRLPRPPRLRMDVCPSTAPSASRRASSRATWTPSTRRKAYDCDITYGTNSEFGFDYLRDNMKPARWGDPNFEPYYQQCQKALQLRHHRRGGQHPHRRGAHAAHHLRPRLQRPVRRYAKANDIAVQLTRPAKEGARAAISRSRKRSTPAI